MRPPLPRAYGALGQTLPSHGPEGILILRLRGQQSYKNLKNAMNACGG